MQFAVEELCRQGGLTYKAGESAQNLGDTPRGWVTPRIRNLPWDEAMETLLAPQGLDYEVRGKAVVLKRRTGR